MEIIEKPLVKQGICFPDFDGWGGGMGLHLSNDRVGSTFVYVCHAVGRGRLQ